MARVFRLWTKKRGDRLSANPLVGNLGEALFFGLLFLMGLVSLVALIANYALDPRPEVTALGFGFWLLLMVLASFVLIGGGGLIYTVLNVRTSAERRSALAARASQIDLISEASTSPKDYPNVPRDTNLINSPGVRLKYRLPVSQSNAWKLLIVSVFALVWNGITYSLLAVAITEITQGEPDWFLTLFTLPFIAVGIWAIVRFVQLMWLHTGIGPTIVEVSAHPLLPGREYQVFFSQAGHLTIKRLKLSLVCEEEATYQQGTDVRTEVRRVFKQVVLRRDDFKISPASVFEEVATFRVPTHVMHTFQSFHNAIKWKLVVQGKAAGWPLFERWFPVIVFPPPGVQGGEDGAAD
ncbi:MAG: hypothetical protein KDA62_04585 [Planctomycetales bacterium]|nr:hypothetical protein [Planctomycetales bacterium]MCA9162228.1 hypothetical protein [Planctomycetales bacterium]